MIVIRTARPDDRQLLYRLAEECLMSGSILGAEDIARLARDILDHTQWHRVALLEGVAVGFLWANLGCPEGLPRVGLAVRADARGHGVGGALLRHACDLARAGGYRGLLLAVDATNHAAIELYERLGFRDVGRMTIPGGHTLINMRCDLEPAAATAPQGADA